MSANMFPKPPTPTTPCRPLDNRSRIPLASPIPLRRHNSLRLRGERDVIRDDNRFRDVSRDANRRRDSSREPNHGDRLAAGKAAQSTANPLLKRGQSFMERNEHRVRNGGENITPVVRRPDNVKIGFKSTLDLPKGVVTTPQSPARVRSLSLSLSNTRLQSSPKSPSISTSSPNNPVTPNYSTNLLDSWDADSITSIGSSVASCDHASIARNGTTFSGRSMKYVFHCNQHAGATGEDYLTPTQRAQRQVKKLKYLLLQAKKDLEEKDSDILKLTKEVVELRLYKAALSSPEDKSNSSDAVTVRENTSEETTPEESADNVVRINRNEFNSSYADSGHFDDFTGSSVHSKESMFDENKSPFGFHNVETINKATSTDSDATEYEAERNKLIDEYEKRIQELVKTHEEESLQMKQKQNDKIEELLQRITEINTRYWQLVPELETAKERIKELEQQLEEASKKLEEQGESSRGKSQSAEEADEVDRTNKAVSLVNRIPNRISVPELLQELQVTKNELENIRDVEYATTSNNSQPLLSAKEALSLWVLGARKAMYRQLMEAKSKNKIDPEITLQFLKSAVYYFLTDKENSLGHLKAIQSILGFSSNEISNIEKARLT
nr:uncharacterized protein LOC111517416 isoform X1 [Leptinotarsa decemlineata]XP_023029340.1 uncharacterized protein LOC111517416 isoform X1 [Leptinotarsa decemlineata]XP_023029341.1 uncharacterized protein LOC111517416 isoform X1 [Leptinotarsa decemlineata]